MYDEPPAPSDTDYPEYAEVRPIKHARNGSGNGAHAVALLRDGWETEAALLATCMAKAACIDEARQAGITRADFTKPLHADIYAACVDLRDNNPDSPAPADPITLHAALNTAVSVAELVTLGEHASTWNVGQYAATLVEYSNRRAWATYAGEVGEALRHGTNPAVIPMPLERNTTSTQEGFFSDMTALTETDPIIPSVMPRDDAATCLFYAPGINWLSGEPGEGKTLIALWAVARELRNGNTVLYLDHEGTDVATRSRLTEMGVTDEQLANLHYKRVSDKWDAASLATLRQHINENRYTIAVIDAVAGAMEAEGLDPDNNRDVEKWGALIPQLLFNTGCAVICIDHVTKNAETRGRWMIGAQRKMARADAAFTLDMFEKAGVGKTGRGKLLVTKDRYGALGEHQSGKIVAQVSIVSTVDVDGDDRELLIRLDTPAGPLGIGTGKPNGPTWYMERVSRVIEDAGKNGVYLGSREIRAAVGGGVKWVDKAVVALLASGHIERILHKGPGKPYRSVVPYRQPIEMIEHANAEQDAPPPDDDDDWQDQPW